MSQHVIRGSDAKSTRREKALSNLNKHIQEVNHDGSSLNGKEHPHDVTQLAKHKAEIKALTGN